MRSLDLMPVSTPVIRNLEMGSHGGNYFFFKGAVGGELVGSFQLEAEEWNRRVFTTKSLQALLNLRCC
jgi:hypothetical protein